MKKGLRFVSVVALAVLGLAGCSKKTATTAQGGDKGTTASAEKMKVGLITLHDENSSYDKNFIDAFKAAADAEGVEAVVRSGIEEGETFAYDATAALVDQGCKFVFADSFGHESNMLKAAKEFKDVEIGHATGTMAHTEKVANFGNAFASIYEGRYLAGVAAGLKLQAMNKTAPKLGYVGAYPFAEVKSGYTSFFLGVQSILPAATMEVKFTNFWYDETLESNYATDLINRGADLISQHADSWGAPTTCEAKKIPNVSYNGSTASRCPETYIVSSKIDWTPYFKHAFQQVKAGKHVGYDYSGTLGSTIHNGAVALTELGKNAAEGTEAKLEEVAGKLRDGSLKVFDCSKFTVNGQHLTSYKADVDTDEAYAKDTEVIKTEGGVTYFAESEFRSAPYFDIDIDGITVLSDK
jgi:basic membrane protein A